MQQRVDLFPGRGRVPLDRDNTRFLVGGDVAHTRQIAQFILDGAGAMPAGNGGNSKGLAWHNGCSFDDVYWKWSGPGCVAKDLGDLGQDALALGGFVALDRSRDAGAQVRVENALADTGQRGLRRLNLLDHVNAVAVLFEHFHNAVDMPRHAFEAVNCVVPSLIVHFTLPNLYPPPWGRGYGASLPPRNCPVKRRCAPSQRTKSCLSSPQSLVFVTEPEPVLAV